MANKLPQNLTQLANDAQHDSEAARQFLAAVYDILREIAHQKVKDRPAPGEAATEVAHEVAADFLSPSSPTTFVNRQQVIGGLATRIAHKIIDLAKRRRRDKRGSGIQHLPIDSPVAVNASSPQRDLIDAIAVEDAFAQLKLHHPNAYLVLKLRNERHTVEDIANKLDVSPKTVVRWTKFGTAFLYGQLSGGEKTAKD